MWIEWTLSGIDICLDLWREDHREAPDPNCLENAASHRIVCQIMLTSFSRGIDIDSGRDALKKIG